MADQDDLECPDLSENTARFLEKVSAFEREAQPALLCILERFQNDIEPTRVQAMATLFLDFSAGISRALGLKREDFLRWASFLYDRHGLSDPPVVGEA